MNDENVQPEDLATDETFIAWFRRSSPEHVQFWDEWIRRHTDKKEVVDKAAELLAALESGTTSVSDFHTAQAKDRLMEAVHGMNSAGRVRPMFRRSIWRASAAAVIAAVVISMIYFAFAGGQIRYATDFAETKSIVLPDGSQVTLNANSKLKINTGWEPGAPREVWLEGEGFFSVKHTANNAKFVVHTSNINVEVLGTEFNLQQRRQHITVVLHTGKVRLTEVDRPNDPPLIMHPGDLVEYNDSTQKIIRKVVQTEMYTAWKEGKMVFDNADFQEIARILEENYGLKVNTGNLHVKGQQFNGIFPANNLQILITALEKAYDVNITINDKKISIQDKKSLGK